MKKKRLLIVDDDPRICNLISRSVKGMNFIVHTLHYPRKLASVYQEFRPDVILVDLKMPGIDGIEVLRQLADWGCSASILIFSGMESDIVHSAEKVGGLYGLKMEAALEKALGINQFRKRLEELVVTQKVVTEEELPISESDLSKAIEDDELVVHYQPKVARRSNQVVGVEALVRWEHPQHGLILPDRFIPFAEKTGLIVPLTYEVLERAFRDLNPWFFQLPDFMLAVNTSSICLMNRDFPDKLVGLIKRYNLRSDQLMLEITESAATDCPAYILDTITRLRLREVQFSMDDFGIGQSTLERLYNFPCSELKVDKSFVMVAMRSNDAAEIVRSTVDLGHRLGLQVVAEGIEDQHTLEWIFELGCDLVQGYHISPPLDAPGFGNWLEEWQRT